MNQYEFAKRLAAWTWAAETLGVEASPERLSGLVKVTGRVRIENLRPALEVAIQTELRGFLPSPGAVIAASNSIADRKRNGASQISGGREMPPDESRKWHAEHNPEQWTTDQWRAHKTLMNRGGDYAIEVYRLNQVRAAWAADQVEEEFGDRKVSMSMRIRSRREYNREARVRFPTTDPITVLASYEATARSFGSSPYNEEPKLGDSGMASIVPNIPERIVREPMAVDW